MGQLRGMPQQQEKQRQLRLMCGTAFYNERKVLKRLAVVAAVVATAQLAGQNAWHKLGSVIIGKVW